MKKFYLLMLLASIGLQGLFAANVKVTMNATAKVMTLVNKATQEPVSVGTATSYAYTFDVDPGTYVLTGWSSDAHTQDYGTIELNVTDEATQEFKVFVITAQCQSYYTDTKTGWAYGTDWTITDLKCNTREGKQIPITLSNYTLVNTSGNKYQYKYFLTLNGSSYSFNAVPSEAKKAEGYTVASGGGTVTANANSIFTFPKAGTFTVTYPEDADFDVWQKPGGTNGAGSIHYVAFNLIKPVSTTTDGGNVVKTYQLADGYTYNYRLTKEGKRTKAGTFVYCGGSALDGKVWADGQDGFQSMTFTDADLAESNNWMNTDVTANNKYNVANILLNINERGHLRMNTGDVKDLMAQRDWQLTNSSTANYFIEPEYHYTVLNLDGTTGNDVVTISKSIGLGVSDEITDGEARSKAWGNAERDFSPWAQLKANKAGSALVLVSYDAISLTQWARSGSGTATSPYKLTQSSFLGGEEWSALWPENTAAFIVTVDDNAPSFDTKMLVNEAYNTGALKNAGQYVDAEHDVFYYLEEEGSYSYTFAPENVASVEIAYPTLTATAATYNGFGTEGVTKNADGSYTILLKKGRQIVRLTGEDGTIAYQVLTAKPCTRTITNKTHNDGKYYPGDEIEIQYAGLYHPANKMSGIYNMSAFVTFKGVPNGTEVTQTGNQYQFAGTPTAQLTKTRIPANWNPAEPFVLDDGVIQVNGFGDPIGNHRYIDPIAGRSPNFTAISHQTYFGAVPEVSLALASPDYKAITFALTPADANSQITLVNPKNDAFAADAEGNYNVIPDTYTYTIITDGYKYVTGSVTITGEETETTTISKTLVAVAENGWDGISTKEPETVTAEEGADESGQFYGMTGYYKIKSGYNLAWVAQNVNTNKVATTNVVLCNDITLSDMPWNTIGNSTTTPYKGVFEGNGHTIGGFEINGTKSYQASLFGYCDNITLRNFTLEGSITSTATYTGAVVSRIQNGCTIYGVNSKVDIAMPGTGSAYAGGIVGWLVGASGAKYTIERCSYDGIMNVTSRNYAAGIVGNNSGNYDNITIKDCSVAGSIKGGNYIAGIIANFGGANSAKAKIENCLVANTITGTGTSVGAIWSYTNAATGVSNCYVNKAGKLTSNQGTVATAAQLASGEIAYKLNDERDELVWGQTIGTDDVPVLGGEEVKYLASSDYYYNTDYLDPGYELRVLTFEDADYKGDGSTQATGEANWTSLIDEQYGGPLLYGESGYGEDYAMYYWSDDNNTGLATEILEGWGSYAYWNGGHAVSNYASGEIATYGGYDAQLTVYKKGVNGLTTSGAGHNGSNNFAVHYGYVDNSGYSSSQCPYLYFSDGVARVIDHMWINNTTYALNCYLDGNGLTAKIGDDDWVKIVATGDNGNTAEFYLCNGPKNIVTDWTKWDLSSLGEVTMVEFNITGSSDNGFGYSQPAYFAYDDVAVRFVKAGVPQLNVSVVNEIATITYEDLINPAQLQKIIADIDEAYTVIDLTGIHSIAGTKAATIEEILADKPNTLAIVPSATDITGTNIINNGECENLVLTDKKNFKAPTAFTAHTATYPKSLDGQGWYTAVLPYDVTVPAGVTALNNAVVESQSIKFTQVAVGETIPANTPFVYRTDVATNLTFEATEVTVETDATPASGALLGTFTAIPKGSATGKLIMTQDGQGFARATDKASIPAFRAYLNGSSSSSEFFAIIIDDDLTGIVSANGSMNQKVNVYTVDGKLVRQNVDAATALQGLGKGTYVVGGQTISK